MWILPNNFFTLQRSSDKKGFTLVELLVVISIISILATVGATLYTGTQKNARDAKRRGDIEAISQALEVNKTDSGYQSLTANQFGSGIPLTGPKSDQYCINTNVGPTAPAVPWTNCTGAGWAAIAASGTPAANSAQFMVCASLEAGGTGGTPIAFCRSSVQ